MRIMLKRILLLGLLCSLALALSCDSSSKGGGGAATGYTQADLAGEWAFRGGNFLKAILKFDATGALLRWKNITGKIFPFVGQVSVAADGALSGKVAVKFAPGAWEVVVFSGMRFNSKDLITGKVEWYAYTAGVGRIATEVEGVKMTRYIPD